MLIILEGCDKCGKTTLANKIVEQFEAEYVKFSQPEKPPYLEYCEFTQSVEPGKDYVLDRFCYGEMVYGPIYRGRAGMSFDEMWEIERTLQHHLGALVIWCNTNTEEITANFVKDNEEFAKSDDIEKIVKGYQNLFTRTIITPYMFNYLQDPSHEKVLNWIEGEMV